MRNAEVIRQWRILKTIEAGRHTTTTALAEDLGVTERTIRRDIEALQEAGFPLYDEREDGRKVWRLVPGLQAEAHPELLPVGAGRPLLRQEPALVPGRRALRPGPRVRLRQDQGGPAAASLPYLARIQDLFAARPQPAKDYSKKKEVIAGLVDATLHQRQAQVAYYSFNSKKKKTYLLDPYRLVYYHGGLYLYARSHEHGEVRTFAVERIEKIEVLDTGFEVPKDFNVSEYARGAFGIAGGKAEEVLLEVDAEVAAYVRERVWHESQRSRSGPTDRSCCG